MRQGLLLKKRETTPVLYHKAFSVRQCQIRSIEPNLLSLQMPSL
jgi:hypothetical protein